MSNQHNDVQPLSSFMNHLSLMTKATIRDYDEILMNELVSNKLDLITEPVLDLCTNVNVYQQWEMVRKEQLISKIAHLPLMLDTMFRLDCKALDLLTDRIDESSILHCISLRSSTLQHKDFINHISSNKYKSKYKNVVLLLQFNEPYQSNSVCFMSNFTLLKSMFAGVILDGFGNGSASLSLLDLFDFDGIKVHSIFKELIDRPGKSKLLIEIIINELVKDGKTIFSPLVLSDEVKEFYKSIGCQYGVVIV